MSDSEKMNVEIERIKNRVEEINKDISDYHKADEKIKEMETNLEQLKQRTNY
ncbi:FAD-I family protein [Fusobacterium necrophorum]|nr:hypothetical protein [Fusobacterium necrophorum]MBR8791169.1 hypothetical protein [Fusobacterium necrophorum]MBR8824076.1 hypothetical protein [Fusobacterium necrophorum]